MAQTLLAVTIACALLMAHGVSAKRGCSAFGHSCFGGHGKRSGEPSGIDVSSNDIISRRQMGQEETPPHSEYPHPGYNVLQPGDDIIPVRDGGAYDREEAGARDLMKLKLRNIFKHWVENYRRTQAQNNDDGFYIENI